jgi:hypothetical protein
MQTDWPMSIAGMAPDDSRRRFDPDHGGRVSPLSGCPTCYPPDEDAMTRPLPDKAEVALEYPDKLYIGTFDRSSRFDAHLDATGVSLRLERQGDADSRKSVHLHLNYELFAEILRDVAKTAATLPADAMPHRQSLAAAAAVLHRSLSGPGG